MCNFAQKQKPIHTPIKYIFFLLTHFWWSFLYFIVNRTFNQNTVTGNCFFSYIYGGRHFSHNHLPKWHFQKQLKIASVSAFLHTHVTFRRSIFAKLTGKKCTKPKLCVRKGLINVRETFCACFNVGREKLVVKFWWSPELTSRLWWVGSFWWWLYWYGVVSFIKS